MVRSKAALAVVCAAVLVALGAGVGLLLAPAPDPSGLEAGSAATVAPATVQQFRDERPVVAEFRVSNQIPLRTARYGVVTAAVIESPGPLASGQMAFWVDAAPVVAIHTAYPLYRDITVGACGEDARTLNAELARLGTLAGEPGGCFTAASRDAWRAIQAAAGVPKPTNQVLLENVLWLPAHETVASSWLIAPGTPVPGDGVVGWVAGRLSRISLTLTNISSGELLPGDHELSLFGQTLAPAELGDVIDADFLAAVSQTAKYVEIIASESRAQANATLRLTTPINALRVPAAAVFGISGREGCVQVMGVGVPVRIVGSSLGGTLVVVDGTEAFNEVAIGTGITLTSCR
ncbi:MAG: hypothetical protein LBH11_02285 [Propionibacteriaceae bacterium]|nr:hypothetical protein [Propionibacteriaceae bacterium]